MKVIQYFIFLRNTFQSYTPDIEGAEDFTGRILHSIDYRYPEEFKGKVVAIVGGRASAIDLAIQIEKMAEKVGQNFIYVILKCKWGVAGSEGVCRVRKPVNHGIDPCLINLQSLVEYGNHKM